MTHQTKTLREQLGRTEYAGWATVTVEHVDGLYRLMEGGIRCESDVELADELLTALVLHPRVAVAGVPLNQLPPALIPLFEDCPKPAVTFSDSDPDLPEWLTTTWTRVDEARRAGLRSLITGAMAAPVGTSEPTQQLLVGGRMLDVSARDLAANVSEFTFGFESFSDTLLMLIGGASTFAGENTKDVLFPTLDEQLEAALGRPAEVPRPDVLRMVLSRAQNVRSRIPESIEAVRAELSRSVTRVHQLLSDLTEHPLHSKEARKAGQALTHEALVLAGRSEGTHALYRIAVRGLSTYLVAPIPNSIIREAVVSSIAEVAPQGIARIRNWFRPSFSRALRLVDSATHDHPRRRLLNELLTREEKESMVAIAHRREAAQGRSG